MTGSTSGRETRFAAALVSLAVLTLVAWQLSFVLLLGFVGVLLAVLVRRPAETIALHTSISVEAALACVIFAGLMSFGLLFYGAGPKVVGQLEQLWVRLPAAFDSIEAWLGERVWGQALLEQLASAEEGRWTILGTIGGTVSTLFGLGANLLIVVTVAIFLALDPALYRLGLVSLVSPGHRDRAHEILDALGEGLWQWLRGQLLCMLVVGSLVALGLWLIGVPLPIALGIVAGLLNIVPYIGPYLGAALLFVVVQQVEGNVIMPLIQKRTTNLPPALTILAVASFGTLFGLLGVFVAAPLLLVVIVLVRMIWVEAMPLEDGSLEETNRVLERRP